MNIEKCNVKIRCDMPNCRNMAKFKIKKDGFLKNAGLFVCEQCVMDLYKLLSNHIVPKSPSNVLNKKISNGVKNETIR